MSAGILSKEVLNLSKVISRQDLRAAVRKYVQKVCTPPNANQYDPVPGTELKAIAKRIEAEATRTIQQTGGEVKKVRS